MKFSKTFFFCFSVVFSNRIPNKSRTTSDKFISDSDNTDLINQFVQSKLCISIGQIGSQKQLIFSAILESLY